MSTLGFKITVVVALTAEEDAISRPAATSGERGVVRRRCTSWWNDDYVPDRHGPPVVLLASFGRSVSDYNGLVEACTTVRC